MPPLKDLTGQKVCRLTIVKRLPNEKIHGHWQVMWECVCDCGNKRVVPAHEINRGHAKSCGCLRHEGLNRKYEKGIAAFHQAYSSLKTGARIRGYELSISLEEFGSLVRQNCYYCGAPPQNIRKSSKGNGSFVYNGIDRIDNSRGYVSGNVVACCKKCNFAKRDMSQEEFKQWVRRIYERYAQG